MEEIKLGRCGLERLSETELQTRGGFSWEFVRKLVQIANAVSKFIDDYGKDIERGFKRGWEKY